MKTHDRAILIVVVVLIVFHQLTLHAGHTHWLLDIFSHVQLQILLAGFLFVVGVCGMTKNKTLCLFGLAYFVGLGVWVSVLTVWQSVAASGTPVTVYFQNTQYKQSGEALRAMADTIAAYNADIIALAEPHPVLINQLTQALYVPLLHYVDSGRSCVVFVRRNTHTVVSTDVVTAFGHDPICTVQFETFDLYVVHPLPPINAVRFARQHAYFAALRAHIEESVQRGRDWLVVGDFNSSLYSPTFRRYFGMYTSSQYYTWSWPSLFTIPIDHAFGSSIQQSYVYPALTSDHRGLGVVLE